MTLQAVMRKLRTRPVAVSALAVATIAAGIAWASFAPPVDPQEIAALAQRAGAGRDGAALAALEKIAPSSPPARRALGEALLARGDAANFAQGLHHLEQAAARGDCAAHLQLGKLHLLGTPLLARDPHRAWIHLNFAAAHGDPAAAHYLGLMLRDGNGVGLDKRAAARWFSVAAQKRLPASMFMLANAYRDGDGVARDEARALSLYRSAAALDHAPSIQALALAYQNGELGLARDEGEAARYAHEAEHALQHTPAQP